MKNYPVPVQGGHGEERWEWGESLCFANENSNKLRAIRTKCKWKKRKKEEDKVRIIMFEADSK
jgi:hypothetical protein